jgi:phage terminase large subunit-like protein
MAQGRTSSRVARPLDRSGRRRDEDHRALEDLHVLGLAYDRWRIADLLARVRPARLAAWEDKGGDKPGTGLRLIPWGQGFKDMAPAIDALEFEVIDRNLEHPSNPVLNWNMANAVATMDPAGNRKLDKDKARFRIDAAVALTMMCGLKSKDRKKDNGEALNRAILERAGLA